MLFVFRISMDSANKILKIDQLHSSNKVRISETIYL